MEGIDQPLRPPGFPDKSIGIGDENLHLAFHSADCVQKACGPGFKGLAVRTNDAHRAFPVSSSLGAVQFIIDPRSE